jgi:hypothetical protein
MNKYPRDFSKRMRKQLADGLTLDAVLSDLRSDGASIMECVKATKTALSRDIEDAKRLVHASKAWADVVKRTDAMWDEVVKDSLQKPSDAN